MKRIALAIAILLLLFGLVACENKTKSANQEFSEDFKELAQELVTQEEYEKLELILNLLNDVKRMKPNDVDKKSKGLADTINAKLININYLAREINPKFESKSLKNDIEYIEKYDSFAGLNIWHDVEKDIFPNILMPRYTDKYEYQTPLNTSIEEIKSSDFEHRFKYVTEYDSDNSQCKLVYLCEKQDKNFYPYSYIEIKEDKKGNVISVTACGDFIGDSLYLDFDKMESIDIFSDETTKIAKEELLDWLIYADRDVLNMYFPVIGNLVDKYSYNSVIALVDDNNIMDIGNGSEDIFGISVELENNDIEISNSLLSNDFIQISHGDAYTSEYEIKASCLEFPFDNEITDNIYIKHGMNYKDFVKKYTVEPQVLDLDIDFDNSDFNINYDNDVDFSLAEKEFEEYRKDIPSLRAYSVLSGGTCVINGNICYVIELVGVSHPGGTYIVDLSNNDTKIYYAGDMGIYEDLIQRVK